MKPLPSSFRDPKGFVYEIDGKIHRKINPVGFEQYESCTKKGIYKNLISNGFINDFKQKTKNNESILIQHQKIPFISYPYEWPFQLYKRAALFHLDLHLYLLDKNFTLSDASPFNIQFIGSKPIFIDLLSIVEYKNNSYWDGYNQFCELFLFPLLITAKKKLNFHNLMSGRISGFTVEQTFKILNIFSLLKPSIFLHVALPYYVSRYNKNVYTKKNRGKGLSKKQFKNILFHLKTLINGLKEYQYKTEWQDYETNNFYLKEEINYKSVFIKKFISKNKNLKNILDIGSNSGLFSEILLTNGAKYVVGLDIDQGALYSAVKRANSLENFLPLFFDARNPSARIGWNESEREGFNDRAKKFDAFIMLAFSHHMIIGNNVPIDIFVIWMLSLPKYGVLEFIPKNDPAIQTLLLNREDIFPNYDLDYFLSVLSKYFSILETKKISKSGRILIELKRK